ncbi:MAG: YhdP family protein [Pontibacterium sp.]
MIKTCTRLCWLFYWLIAAFLGLVAISAIIFRLCLPLVGEYRQSLAEKLTALSGQQVSIKHLSAGWQGLNPYLQVEGLTVGEQLLAVQSASVELDVTRTLLLFDPVFKHAEIISPTIRLDLARLQAPRAEPLQETQPSTQALDKAVSFAHWILRQGDAHILKGRIHLALSTGDYELSDIELHMQGDPDGSGSGQLTVGAQVQHNSQTSKVSLLAHTFEGRVARFTEAYAEIDPVELAPLFHALLPSSDKVVQNLPLGGRIWANFEKRQLTSARLELEAHKSQFNGVEPAKGQAAVTLMPLAEGFQLQVRGSASIGDKLFQLPLISADWRSDLTALPDVVAMDRIDLAAVAGLFDGRPWLPHIGQRAISQLQPKGEIKNLNLRWLSPEINSFELVADLVNIEVGSWSGAPAMGGINGRLEHNINGGFVDLVSSNFTMSVADIGMPLWAAQTATGHVRWDISNDAINVSSGLLQVSVKGTEASGRFSLNVPFDNSQQSRLFLLIGAENGDGDTLKHFIPSREVGEKTHKWLLDALSGGIVKRGMVMVSAPTRLKLPGTEKPNAQIYLEGEGINFEFDRQWPIAKGDHGRFYFRDGHFMVEAKGQMLDSQIDWAWAHHKRGEPDLILEAAATGGAVDLHRILFESPIQKQLDGSLGDWQWKGQAQSTLSLSVPLFSSKDTESSGKEEASWNPHATVGVQLADAEFWSDEQRLKVVGLKGGLVFDTLAGLSSDGLSGHAFGYPVTTKITSKPTEGEGKNSLDTYIDIAGSTSIDTMRDWLKLPILGVMKGQTAFQAKLKVGANSRSLVVTSDLEGIRVDAPPPLQKTANQKPGHRPASTRC